MNPSRRAWPVAAALLAAGAWWAVVVDGPWWSDAVVATAAVVVAIASWTQVRQARRRHAAPAGRTWRTRNVLAGATLGAALDKLGAAGGDVPSGGRLGLAWSATEVELSRDGSVLLTLRWDEVREVDAWTAEVGGHRCRLVRLYTRRGAHLDLLPTSRPVGMPMWATRVDAFAWELQDVRDAADPPPPPPPPLPVPQTRVIVPSADDDDRRPVDVELSATLLWRIGRSPTELQLRPDERPGEVDVPWTREELGAATFHMYFVEMDKVPLERGAGVGADATRVCDYLKARYPGLAADALRSVWDDYCFRYR